MALLAEYAFNEGSGTSAAPVGSGSTITGLPSTWSTGKNGSSIEFSGQQGPTISPFSTGEAFTIMLWLYVTVSPSGWCSILEGTPTNDLQRVGYLEYNSSRALDWFHENGGEITGGTLSLNTWTHIAITADGTTRRLFVNGTQVGSASSSLDAPSDGFVFGSTTAQPGNHRIDELRFYDEALDAATITTLMNTPVGGGGGATEPVPLTVPGSSGWVTGSTSLSVPRPSGNQAGDRLYLIVHAKQTTAAGTTIATPSSWTLLTQSQGGSTSAPGNGSGSTRIAVFYQDLTNFVSGNLTVPVANGNSSAACMWIVRPDPTYTGVSWDSHVFTQSNLTSGSTNLNTTFSSLAFGPEDLAALVIGTADDTSDPFTCSSMSATGTTFTTPTKTPDPGYGITTGNDSGGAAWWSRSSGTSSSGVSIVASQNTAETAHRLLFRISAVGTPPGANYAGSVSLSGAGAFTVPTRTPAVSGSGGLSGSGGITVPVRIPGVEGIILPTGSGTLALDGFASVAYSGSVSLGGTGTLGGSPDTINATGTFASTGTSDLGLSGTPAFTRALGLSGTGSLSGAGTPAITGAAGLSGAGSLAAQAVAGVIGSLSRTGEGALTASGTFGVTVDLPLDGSGDLGIIGEGVESYSGSVSLTGEGALGPTQEGFSTHKAVSLAGEGALSGTALVSTSGGTALSGTGSLSGAGSPGHRGSVATGGAGALSGAGSAGVSGALETSGEGSVGSSATMVTLLGALGRSGEGFVTLATGAVGTIGLSGSGTLSRSATKVTQSGSVGLSGEGDGQWEGSLGIGGAVALLGGGSLAATGSLGAVAVLARAGDGSLSLADVLVDLSGGLDTSGEGLLSLVTGEPPNFYDLRATILAPVVRATISEVSTEATIKVDMTKAVIVEHDTTATVVVEQMEAVL